MNGKLNIFDSEEPMLMNALYVFAFFCIINTHISYNIYMAGFRNTPLWQYTIVYHGKIPRYTVETMVYNGVLNQRNHGELPWF